MIVYITNTAEIKTHVIASQSADWRGNPLDIPVTFGDRQKVNCPKGAREATLGCTSVRAGSR